MLSCGLTLRSRWGREEIKTRQPRSLLRSRGPRSHLKDTDTEQTWDGERRGRNEVIIIYLRRKRLEGDSKIKVMAGTLKDQHR